MRIITELRAKYTVTELCEHFGVSRTFFYYKKKLKKSNSDCENAVIRIFHESKDVYGQEKLKIALKKEGYSISQRKIGEIMRKYNLVSKYVSRRKKVAKLPVNTEKTENKLGRKFHNREPYEVMVSDLTYVDVNNKWHYICLIIELAHREIIGFSAGANKDAKLVETALYSIKTNLGKIKMFHTDRGGEFKNDELEKILKSFNIERSLSHAGTPIDNAVAESMYDVLKTEFVYGATFKNLSDLRGQLEAWVWWYNNKRLHGSLGFKTPVESRENAEICTKCSKRALIVSQKIAARQ